LSCAALLLVNFFNADIFFAIISCGSHVIGVFVPPVLALDGGCLSLSRLMMVVTNALSMADIPTLKVAASELSRAGRNVKVSDPTAGVDQANTVVLVLSVGTLL
jgi:hypothetical protein